MPLSASFVADFSSFIDQTKAAVTAMQGFKLSAEELGPGIDRGLDAVMKKYEQVGRQTKQLAQDTFTAGQTFITAYAEEQEAVSRLNAALAATGQATPAVIQAYADMATQFQATTRHADEAIVSAQAVLTTIGKVGPDQMQLALTAVTNLAAGMKIDLATAANMVAKAVGSGGESLGKLNVALDGTIEKGAPTADILQAINNKFAGQSAADMQNWTAQMAQLNNLMSDFNEKVGKVLVDNLSKVLGAFQSLPEPVQNFTLAVVTIGTVLAPVLVSLASLVSLLTTSGLGAGIISAFTAILGFITFPEGVLIVAIVALAAAVAYNWDAIVGYTQKLYEGIKTWLVDKFTGLVSALQAKIGEVVAAFTNMYNTVVGHSIVPDMINGIGQEFSRLDSAMVQPVAEATAQVNAHLKLMAAQMRANAILNQNSLFTTPGQLEQVASIFEASAGGGGGGGGPVTINNTFNISGGTEELVRRVKDEIMRSIQSGTQLGMA